MRGVVIGSLWFEEPLENFDFSQFFFLDFLDNLVWSCKILVGFLEIPSRNPEESWKDPARKSRMSKAGERLNTKREPSSVLRLRLSEGSYACLQLFSSDWSTGRSKYRSIEYETGLDETCMHCLCIYTDANIPPPLFVGQPWNTNRTCL